MARDDYFVIVYKILTHLYKCLKQSNRPNIEYLQPLTKDFPIEQYYFNYIIEKMVESEFIENVILIQADDEVIVKMTDSIRITPSGIEYLQENKMMKKVGRVVKGIVTTLK